MTGTNSSQFQHIAHNFWGLLPPSLSAMASIQLSPPLQQWSAFAITHPPPLPADVICEQPLTVMHEEKE